MKAIYQIPFMALSLLGIINLTGCSNDDKDKEGYSTITVGFSSVSADLIGGPTAQGENLYLGSNYEIEKGYITPLAYNKYVQFAINYGLGYSVDFQKAGWGYSFSNGGIAVSNWHDMKGDTYLNQLSVYDETSPSGGNFVVANGFSQISDPSKAQYSDYEGCGKVYLTDSQGYGITNIGQPGQVDGKDEEGWFKSVYVNNTTYTYYVMKNGNGFRGLSLEEQKGWLKVQFIAFDDNDSNEKPLGYVEAYLANFDENLNIGWTGILDEWIKVDLSKLPECSILVVNFVGSDNGEWGLNTPAYCALDQFEITVEE